MNKKRIMLVIAIVVVIVVVLIMFGATLADKFMEIHGKSFIDMHLGK